jgi:hypothetical protein
MTLKTASIPMRDTAEISHGPQSPPTRYVMIIGLYSGDRNYQPGEYHLAPHDDPVSTSQGGRGLRMFVVGNIRAWQPA